MSVSNYQAQLDVAEPQAEQYLGFYLLEQASMAEQTANLACDQAMSSVVHRGFGFADLLCSAHFHCLHMIQQQPGVAIFWTQIAHTCAAAWRLCCPMSLTA